VAGVSLPRLPNIILKTCEWLQAKIESRKQLIKKILLYIENFIIIYKKFSTCRKFFTFLYKISCIKE